MDWYNKEDGSPLSSYAYRALCGEILQGTRWQKPQPDDSPVLNGQQMTPVSTLCYLRCSLTCDAQFFSVEGWTEHVFTPHSCRRALDDLDANNNSDAAVAASAAARANQPPRRFLLHCGQCDRVFPNCERLRKHLCVTEDPKVVLCRLCAAVLRRDHDLRTAVCTGCMAHLGSAHVELTAVPAANADSLELPN